MVARGGELPLRADAQRNRDRILTTAARMFAEQGLDVTFDAIATEAGGGLGDAVPQLPQSRGACRGRPPERVRAAVRIRRSVPEGSPPLDALRQWMSGFLDYASAKLGMADALRGSSTLSALHIPTRAA